jgi:hypothetical protein
LLVALYYKLLLFKSWKDGHLDIFCTRMLCICYWSDFTCDIEYHNTTNFQQTKWNEKNIIQAPFQQKQKKTLIYKNIIF